MTWMSTLYKTYAEALKFSAQNNDDTLMPISHSLQNAHLNIVIDEMGNFKRATVLEKTQIILPATESSAGRSSNDAPHPLADKLQYIAKDYATFGGAKKAYFESYAAQLRAWCESDFSHPKARAVYRYIEKGEVIKDLIDAKIVYVDDTNKLLTRWPKDATDDNPTPLLFRVLPKEKGALDQGNALVCWTVETEGESAPDTWKDKSLQQSWIDFDANNESEQGFCFVTGKNVPLALSHPAKLRHTGDKAKLISSNDAVGYTYRGKFITDEEACGVGFEVTQKAHNALRWLISKNGYRNGEQVIVAWAVSGKDVPSPFITTYELTIPNDFDDEIAEPNQEEKAPDQGRNLGQEFAAHLKKKLAGYCSEKEIGKFEAIIIMGLDSATPGRMSITYYREANAEEFFKNLESWHLDFAWPQRYTKTLPGVQGKKSKQEVIWPVSSPILKAIAEAAYGQAVKESLKKSTVERIIPCILEKRPFPKDLLDACVQSASNPVPFKDNKWQWHKNVSITCALFRGYHSQRNPKIEERRNYQMSLDRECTSRDYLYGRLLAVAEQLEARALYRLGEKRITSAERYMQGFASHPNTTWTTIHGNLSPYFNRLKFSEDAGLFRKWRNEIEEIKILFIHDEYLNNEPLSGEYLLGYYCQKNDLKQKAKNETESSTSENQPNPEETK